MVPGGVTVRDVGHIFRKKGTMITVNVLEQKSKARERAIDGLLAMAKAKGGCEDRMYWTLVWDLEMAPITTNAAQLAEIGYEPLASEQVRDAGLSAALRSLVHHLALIGVYIMRTEHLTDRELYVQLTTGILHEPIRDLPPSPEVVEWIDLSLGTYDDGEDVYLSVYATDQERLELAEEDPTCRLPPRRERVATRDAMLPRP